MVKDMAQGKQCKRHSKKSSTVDSTVLLNQTDIDNLESWFGNKALSLELLYRASEYYCNVYDFRDRVDGRK